MTTPHLEAFGMPIPPIRGRPSSSETSLNVINVARLLDRIDVQLMKEENASQHDPWQTSSLALALTHAASQLDGLQKSPGTDISLLRLRLQSATQRYIALHPLQKATLPNSQSENITPSNDQSARSFLLQDFMKQNDSDSEFDEEEQGVEEEPRQTDREHDGKEGEGITGNTLSEEDNELQQYEAATKLRQRKKPPSKGDAEKDQQTIEPQPTALQSERSIQDALSGELLRMAGVLKANSVRFADALERDRKVLEEAGEKLQANLTLMTRTRGRLGEYSRKARGMGWITLGSIAVVGMSWAVMFVIIRLT